MSDDFRIGDHWMISDRSGRKFRASEMRREWNGKLVHESEWEPRHPQELARPRRRERPVKESRPRPLDTYIGPLHAKIGAVKAAGSTRLVLDSAERFAVFDEVTLMLDDKDAFMTTVITVYDLTDIEIADPLPCQVSVGNDIINRTAMSTPSL